MNATDNTTTGAAIKAAIGKEEPISFRGPKGQAAIVDLSVLKRLSKGLAYTSAEAIRDKIINRLETVNTMGELLRVLHEEHSFYSTIREVDDMSPEVNTD